MGAVTSGALSALYKEVILDHHDSPRNFGKLENPSLVHEGRNPLCGDHVEIFVKFGEANPNLIEKIRFEGAGCAICISSASILMEEAEGKSKDEVQAKIQEFRDLLQGKIEPEEIKGDASALAGVRAFPVRIKCALLPWTTLKEAFDGVALPTTTESETFEAPTHDEVLTWLAPIIDPELHLPLVDLGLIYSSKVEASPTNPAKGIAFVNMTLTSAGCPAAGYLVDQVKKRLEEHPKILEANVEIVFQPKWDPVTMASDDAKERLGIW